MELYQVAKRGAGQNRHALSQQRLVSRSLAASAFDREFHAAFESGPGIPLFERQI